MCRLLIGGNGRLAAWMCCQVAWNRRLNVNRLNVLKDTRRLPLVKGAICGSKPLQCLPERPKLSDPAHEGVGLQLERDGRVRCSAWLNKAATRSASVAGGWFCIGQAGWRGDF